MAMRAILEVQRDATFIQSESSEYYHPMKPEAEKVAYFLAYRELNFQGLDYQFLLPPKFAVLI